MPDFRAKIAHYIAREAKPPEKFGHQPRLYALTKLIGAGHAYDDDVVYAAAWLHDLGVFAGHRPEDPAALARWDNVAYAMERVPSILTETGFPDSRIPAVVEVIRSHQPASDPASIEAIILRDADILEQLGAIGIMRTVCKIGRDTRFATFNSAAQSLRRALDTLPGAIRLESTVRLAKPKIEALRGFLAALETEAQPDLY
jgi:uncharacterized protein